MEFFSYEDWKYEGRRRARATGKPNIDTETFNLETDGTEIFIYYTVELVSKPFKTLIDRMSITQFSNRFFSMMAVEEDA